MTVDTPFLFVIKKKFGFFYCISMDANPYNTVAIQR